MTAVSNTNPSPSTIEITWAQTDPKMGMQPLQSRILVDKIEIAP